MFAPDPDKYYTALDYLSYDNENIKEFVQKILGKKVDATIPYHLNTYFILERIKNSHIRRLILQKVLELDININEPFPEDKFASMPQVKSAIMNLKKEYEYYNYYLDKGQQFITLNNLRGINVICNPKLNKFVFRRGFDLILQMNKSNECFIMINPALKDEYFSLFNIYNKLKKLEHDTWILYDDGLILKTTKNKLTSINPETLLMYVNKFDLKK